MDLTVLFSSFVFKNVDKIKKRPILGVKKEDSS